MYTSEQRDEILQSFDEGVATILTSGNSVLGTNPGEIVSDLDAISDYVKINVNNAVFSKIPEGAPAPHHLVRVGVSELSGASKATHSLSIVIRSSVSSSVPFKFHYSKANNAVTAQNLVDFVAGAIRSVLNSAMAATNLEEVNEFFAEGVESANLDYSIKFIPRSTASRENNYVERVDNDAVVFIADDDRAFEVPNFIIFSEIDEDDEFAEKKEAHKESSRAKVLEQLAGLDRPIDFLGAKLKLVKVLTSLTNHEVSTIVSKSYSRKVSKSIEKVNKDLDILVRAEDDVLGAVHRDGETGDFSVILDPFHKKTLERSDIDLVAEVKKQLAAA